MGTSRLRNDNGSQRMFSKIVGWKLNLLLKALARAGREKQNTHLVVCRSSQSNGYCRLDLAKTHDSQISGQYKNGKLQTNIVLLGLGLGNCKNGVWTWEVLVLSQGIADSWWFLPRAHSCTKVSALMSSTSLCLLGRPIEKTPQEQNKTFENYDSRLCYVCNFTKVYSEML